jgi:hypothetical protein
MLGQLVDGQGFEKVVCRGRRSGSSSGEHALGMYIVLVWTAHCSEGANFGAMG